MSDENNILLAIIAEVREALGTPENVGIGHHARQVVAEAQRAREDLTQAVAALSVIAVSLEQVQEDYDTTFALLQAAQVDARRWRALMQPGCEATMDIVADAERWRAMPWETICDAVMPLGDNLDAIEDLRHWYERNKPQEVQV